MQGAATPCEQPEAGPAAVHTPFAALASPLSLAAPSTCTGPAQHGAVVQTHPIHKATVMRMFSAVPCSSSILSDTNFDNLSSILCGRKGTRIHSSAGAA